tara:strand:- start:387 stop:644 length:258 start_codon:yes stop_codon:yes gene_type:complete
LNFGLNLAGQKVSRASLGDNQNFASQRHLLPDMPEAFANAALDSIACDGPSDFLGHRDPQLHGDFTCEVTYEQKVLTPHTFSCMA